MQRGEDGRTVWMREERACASSQEQQLSRNRKSREVGGQRERSWILTRDSSVYEGGGSGQCWGGGCRVSEWTVIEFTTRGRWRAVGRIPTEFEG